MEFTTDGNTAIIEEILVGAEDAGQRADIYLAAQTDVSRSAMQKLLEEGRVSNGTKILKANYKVRSGDTIRIVFKEPERLQVEPKNIPLNIIFEDKDVVVINKARGMVVHPAPGNYTGTLVNALLYMKTGRKL